ncbi:DEAD/DEAH box helicase family protein [Caulobacter sp.]|uniref:DEAD/DEAH box helicase family protein n=1 Tax=Caulobacter sp. TaxID=78 RepID=UPI003BAA56B1
MIREGEGGHASIDLPPAARGEVAEAYRGRIAEFEKRPFWTVGEADYRPERGLRWPQRRAIAFAQAYLAARGVAGNGADKEAALIKMPTGTGKSGVIAALACASPGVGKTLILTPRTSLVRQMGEDLTTRFWSKLGARYTQTGLEEGLDPDDLAELPPEPADLASRPVRRLVAEQYAHIMSEAGRDRQIWVGTFNALHLILGIKPPAHREFYRREERAPGATFSEGKDGEPGLDLEAFRDLLKSVDLVIVDEGHHEPAFSWAQAVRELDKPTIIFTATPSRSGPRP